MATKEELQKALDVQLSKFKTLAPVYYIGKTKHTNSRGERLDFRDRRYLEKLYLGIDKWPLFVAKKSAQCGISELMIVVAHYEAAQMGLTVLYVLPKYEIRNRFVNNRIYKLYKRNAYYSHLIREAETRIQRTSLTHFGKGTIAFIGSQVESEFIEIPADSGFVDELDRCNQQNIGLIHNRLLASPYQYQRRFTTPTVDNFGIDIDYNDSTKSVWMIKCPHCGKSFRPDFFQHVVRETEPGLYVPLDPDYEPDNDTKELKAYHTCGKQYRRLVDGEWVDEYRSRSWKGVWISQMFGNPRPTALREQYKVLAAARGNQSKLQDFFNNTQGMSFTTKGSKILDVDLQGCMVEYDPRTIADLRSVKLMGIDVGAEIHYVVRDIVRDQHNVACLRQAEVGRVPAFSQLDNVIEKYHPKVIVIDALPEIHKVLEFKTAHREVYSSMFQEGLKKIGVNKSDREIKMDRTAILDYVQDGFASHTLLLPKNAAEQDNGQYFSHLKASTRILEVNEKNPDESRFIWVHTLPDHYFLAEAYCFQAWQTMPDLSALEFFAENKGTGIVSTAKIGVSEEEKRKLERISRVSPSQVLGNLQTNYAKSTTPRIIKKN